MWCAAAYPFVLLRPGTPTYTNTHTHTHMLAPMCCNVEAPACAMCGCAVHVCVCVYVCIHIQLIAHQGQGGGVCVCMCVCVCTAHRASRSGWRGSSSILTLGTLPHTGVFTHTHTHIYAQARWRNTMSCVRRGSMCLCCTCRGAVYGIHSGCSKLSCLQGQDITGHRRRRRRTGVYE